MLKSLWCKLFHKRTPITAQPDGTLYERCSCGQHYALDEEGMTPVGPPADTAK